MLRASCRRALWTRICGAEGASASWGPRSRVTRSLDKFFFFGLLDGRGAGCEIRDASACGCEGFANAMRCGATGDIVAVERGAEGDEVEEVFAELRRERAEICERNCIELKIFVETKADGIADDLVGFAEGHAFVREVGGSGHRVKVAGFCGALHNTEAELQRASKVRQHAEEAGEGVGDVEDLLLTFLEVFVVGERQAFYQG